MCVWVYASAEEDFTSLADPAAFPRCTKFFLDITTVSNPEDST